MKIWRITALILILYCSSFAQQAELIDEFVNGSCEDYLSRMANAHYSLTADLNAKVYFLIYEGKEFRLNANGKKSKLVFPTFGSAKAKIYSIKMRFKFMQAEHLLDRIVFIEAGFRENFTLEIWNVPNGATLPKPTPTLTKMKYRKGKPVGFCAGCC